MKYQKKMSTPHPGLVIFLVDQSGSMSAPFEGNISKADFTALVINRTINEIINANSDGTRIKDRCVIMLIGYGSQIKEIQTSFLNDLANNPIRMETKKRKVPDGVGGLVDVDYHLPIWIEGEAFGTTPMTEAFEKANDLVSGWISQRPDGAAPIVLNISDGMPDKPILAAQAARKLMANSCTDGNALLFNIHISVNGKSTTPIELPDSKVGLSGGNAEFMYDISSEIPQAYQAAASGAGLTVKSNSKGYIYNANAELLV